jgi:glutaminase
LIHQPNLPTEGKPVPNSLKTNWFSFLTNDGFSIHAKREIVTESYERRFNAIMLTCGSYDEAGEFAYRVGLPGKKSVAVLVVSIMPYISSFEVLSPEGQKVKGSVLQAGF